MYLLNTIENDQMKHIFLCLIKTVITFGWQCMNCWYLAHAHKYHEDVMKWKHCPCYWPFVSGIHRSPVNSIRTGQRRWALMFYLTYAWTNGWVNNWDAGGLRRHRAHYHVTVMFRVNKFNASLMPPLMCLFQDEGLGKVQKTLLH